MALVRREGSAELWGCNPTSEETANMSKRAVADAKVAYAHAEAYSNGDDAEAYAEVGICKAEVEAGMFSAGANLLNASAGAKDTRKGAGAMARAELASVSAGVGPVKVKAGLGVDTGLKAGNDGVEVKVLGTGLNLGPKPSISVLGSEAECIVM